ncbi:class I SAM-dependent methyltransferase [Microbacterium sp. VKM Ac-2870]|uniref:class I SAM-dependent methyltransferase n=1 Tax=Microbacterium sp. VKM Ac-2870 TaxID=2783825 RepID=UPI002B26A808|nr:class I SAM-dependent methyltransferase [Microbacterium sp. VKM Ac-2870]
MVLEAIPNGAVSALDVGAGDGLLAAELRAVLPDVTGLDLDPDVLHRAAAEHRDINWIHGDAMTFDFGRTFDMVASVATVHHLPNLADAFGRLADLTSPGGAVVVIGLARPASLRDHAMGIVGAVQHQWYTRTRNVWTHSAPTVWPPPHTYKEVRDCAAAILPGSTWKQFSMWRYAVTWQKPEIDSVR